MGPQYDQALKNARALGEQRHPEAQPHHHASFANSVAYAVTGWSGGYGGPSMREHYASRVLHRFGVPGQIPFDTAIALVEQACYGPLTLDIARVINEGEHCFDDAPGEQEKALQLLHEAGEDPEDDDADLFGALPFNPELN